MPELCAGQSLQVYLDHEGSTYSQCTFNVGHDNSDPDEASACGLALVTFNWDCGIFQAYACVFGWISINSGYDNLDEWGAGDSPIRSIWAKPDQFGRVTLSLSAYLSGLVAGSGAFVSASLNIISAVESTCISDCGAGSGDISAGSIRVRLGMGRDDAARPMGVLRIDGTAPSRDYFTPAALTYIPAPSVQVIRDDVTGWIQRVEAPQALAVVVTGTGMAFPVSSGTSYEIQFFRPAQPGAQASGSYQSAASVIWRIESPDLSGSWIKITEFQNPGQSDARAPIVSEYRYSNDDQDWSLTTGNGLTTETKSVTWLQNGDRVVVDVVKDAQGIIASRTKKTYRILGCNADATYWEALVESSKGDDSAPQTTTYEYYDDPIANAPYFKALKQVTYPDGRWEKYYYDSIGRMAKTVSCYRDNPVDSEESLNRVLTITNTNVVPEEIRVETVAGVEVSRVYTSKSYGAGYSLVTTEQRCLRPDAVWDDPDNLKTVTVACSNYRGDASSGQPMSVTTPDGATTRYGYQFDGGLESITVAEPNDVQTCTTTNAAGKVMGVITSSTAGLLTSSTTPSVDSRGRPLTISYNDGTSETFSYSCCGIDTKTDRFGITTHYEYDDLKRVWLEMNVTEGIKTVYKYDAKGNRVQIMRKGSDESSIDLQRAAYDLSGALVSSTDALNQVTTYAKTTGTGGHTLKTTTYPGGGTRVEEYYQDGSLYKVTGSAVHPIKYEYLVGGDPAACLGTKEIKLGDNGEETEWTLTWTDMAGRTSKIVRPTASGSAVTTYLYNNKGQLDRVIDPDWVTTAYAYDPTTGEQTTVAVIASGTGGAINTSGSDRITTTTTTYPSGDLRQTTTQVYGQGGTPITAAVTTTDGYGTTTTSTRFGLLTSSSTTLDPSSSTRTVTTTYPDQSSSIQSYTGNRLVSQILKDANGTQVSGKAYEYDAHGRQWKITDARNGTTVYTYYDNDQVQNITTPKPDDASAAQTISYKYDAMGRKTEEHLPDGGVIYTEYWPTGEVKNTHGARTYAVDYTYDSQGRKLTMTTGTYGTTGNRATTTWHREPSTGLVSFKEYADGNGTSYTYTPGGKVLTRVWARGITTTYGYGFAGELVSLTYSDGVTTNGSLTYDRLGHLSHVSDAIGGRSFTNTNDGQVARETFEAGSLLAGGTLTRSFDSLLRTGTVSVTPPGGSAIVQTIGYDSASRYQTFTESGIVATYSYAQNSSLVSGITLQNSGSIVLTTAKIYDNLNRLQSISQSVGSRTVSSYAYTNNAANQRIRAMLADGSYWVYEYNDKGEVISGKRYWSNGSPVVGQQFEYAYDDIGNRVSTTTNGQPASYTANNLNQYIQRDVPRVFSVVGSANDTATVTVDGSATSRHGSYFAGASSVSGTPPVNKVVTITGVKPMGASGTADVVTVTTGTMFVPATPETFTHDLDGNLTADGRWTYTWDAENRLIQMDTIEAAVSAGAPRQRLQFTYDWQGRRVQKVLLESSDGANYTTVSTTRFLYNGWNLTAELDGSNNANSLIRSYFWGLDLSGSPQGAGGVGGLLALTTTGTSAATYFPCYDGNGNVLGLVDTSGSSVAIYEYGPFGEPIRVSGTMAGQNPFRFSTKRTNELTGYIDYDLRDYIPSLGRWVRRDLIEEQGGGNSYAFSRNIPISRWDILGLYSLDFESSYTYPFWNQQPHFSQSEIDGINHAQDQVLDAVNTMLNSLPSWAEKANKLCDSCVQKRAILRMLPDLTRALKSMRDGLVGNTSLKILRTTADSDSWGSTNRVSWISLDPTYGGLVNTFCHEVSHIAAKTDDPYRASDPEELYQLVPWKDSDSLTKIMDGPIGFGTFLRNWFINKYGVSGCAGKSSDQWPFNK